ncbi:hypothetical protein IU468_24155 [Nocardia farcinica]|nr:hypothetical protein DXT66_06815 [Nocardia farcinica]MBF6259386.1 hypothetical protein [Nocardia farcinica]
MGATPTVHTPGTGRVCRRARSNGWRPPLRPREYASCPDHWRPSARPVGTFSYDDHVLDTAVLLGALPERVRGIDDELDRCCAAARGHQSGFGGTTVGEPGLRARDPRRRGVVASLRDLVAAAAVVRRSCA